MKKILILYLLAAVFPGCKSTFAQNRQQLAELLVKRSLDSTLNDPGSYQAISFKKLDTIFTKYENDPTYLSAKHSQDSVNGAFENWKISNPDYSSDEMISHERVVYFTGVINKHTSDELKYLKMANKIADDFKPKIENFILSHKYRAKNGFGALSLYSNAFIIDTAITKVIDIKEN